MHVQREVDIEGTVENERLTFLSSILIDEDFKKNKTYINGKQSDNKYHEDKHDERNNGPWYMFSYYTLLKIYSDKILYNANT